MKKKDTKPHSARNQQSCTQSEPTPAASEREEKVKGAYQHPDVIANRKSVALGHEVVGVLRNEQQTHTAESKLGDNQTELQQPRRTTVSNQPRESANQGNCPAGKTQSATYVATRQGVGKENTHTRRRHTEERRCCRSGECT